MQRHRNNIGLLRLLFASLVIVGHAPELIDGNRHREPLTVLFHTISLGELSVDAFFLLSGYLITASMFGLSNLTEYLRHRVQRIYPAYIVALLISVCVLGPFVGADPFENVPAALARLTLLRGPRNYSGALDGLSYPLLNGAMWTIFHEFRSYLIIAALWACGLLQQRRVITIITLMLVLATFAATFEPVRAPLDRISLIRGVGIINGDGGLWASLKFTTVFMLGSCVYLWRDRLLPLLTGPVAVAALILGVGALFNAHTAELGLVIFAGTALFWLALKAELGKVQKVNDRWDISYGVYLYGWPIQTALLYFNRSISPLALTLIALPLAMLAGTASWWLVERWTKAKSQSKNVPQRTFA